MDCGALALHFAQRKTKLCTAPTPIVPVRNRNRSTMRLCNLAAQSQSDA
jgi:hypothetical protein